MKKEIKSWWIKNWFGLTITLISLGSLSSVCVTQNVYNSSQEDSVRLTSVVKKETDQPSQEVEDLSMNYLVIENGIIRGFKSDLNLPKQINLSISLAHESAHIDKIGENAFANRDEIETVWIGEGLSEIGRNAFSGCKNLKSVVIPSSVTKIGSGVFRNCPKLVHNTIASSSPVIFDWWVNHQVDNGQTLELMSVVDLTEQKNSAGQPFSIVGEEAFAWCNNLKEIALGDEVNEIHDRAFKNCLNLISVTLPASLTKIGMNVFESCDKLTCRGLINHSAILFDWWFRKHLYHGRALSELSAINLAGYKNSDHQPFRIIAEGTFNFPEENSILQELIIPETIKKIKQNDFALAKSLKKLVILSSELNYNKIFLHNVSEQVEIYVADSELRAKLIDWGFKEKQIHILTNTPHFFMTEQNELVALTKNGQKAATLVITPEIKLINELAFLGSQASLIDFTKVNADSKLKINGRPFSHFNGEYKVKDEVIKKRLIDAGAHQEKISWAACSAKSVSKSWLIASTVSLAIIGVGLGVGIPLYLRYRKTKTVRE